MTNASAVKPPQSTRHVSAKAFELDDGRAKNYSNVLSKLGYKNQMLKQADERFAERARRPMSSGKKQSD